MKRSAKSGCSCSVVAALSAMGGMKLSLSIVGIYALLSFMVTRRTREIGIRIALGATSTQVLRTITGGAMLYLAIGGAVGSALSLRSTSPKAERSRRCVYRALVAGVTTMLR